MRSDPFILLCATGLFAIFSSTISKSPVLPLFASHLGADPAGVGIVASISAFTGVVASIPAGMLSDRWGRKVMLLSAAFIFSTAPFLYLFVTKIWQLALVRFYHGFATAIFIPVSMALISDMFNYGRGEKMGWFSSATLMGRFMAPVVGGTIIGAMALNPGSGYKYVYIACGISGISALMLTLNIVPFSYKSNTDGFPAASKSWRENLNAFRLVISNRAILITSLVEASILFAYGTLETFLPLYSINAGLSAYAVGIFLSSQVITLALTKPLLGRFSDRHGRIPQICAGALIGALCIAGFPLFRSFIPLLLFSMLFGLSISIVTSATSAFIADLSRRETHGSAMGILGSVMDIGHSSGPLISGIIAANLGFGMSFAGAFFVLVAAALVFLSSVRNFSMI